MCHSLQTPSETNDTMEKRDDAIGIGNSKCPTEDSALKSPGQQVMNYYAQECFPFHLP